MEYKTVCPLFSVEEFSWVLGFVIARTKIVREGFMTPVLVILNHITKPKTRTNGQELSKSSRPNTTPAKSLGM